MVLCVDQAGFSWVILLVCVALTEVLTGIHLVSGLEVHRGWMVGRSGLVVLFPVLSGRLQMASLPGWVE